MEWWNEALCKGMEDSEKIFFDRGRVAEAKAICEACPVKQECLEFAMSDLTNHGVWGGLSHRQRRHLNAERNKGLAS